MITKAEITDDLVERAAYAFEKAGGGDPDQMTYITDDGIQQPYGPAYMWHVDAMRAALQAIAKPSPKHDGTSENEIALTDLIENDAYEIPAWVRTCLRGIRQNIRQTIPKNDGWQDIATVTDEMVERANAAYWKAPSAEGGFDADVKAGMRAALEAAFAQPIPPPPGRRGFRTR